MSRVRIDPDRCQGHLRCVAIADDLFEADELGFGRVIGGSQLSDEQRERALLAVNNCPEYAVEIDG